MEPTDTLARLRIFSQAGRLDSKVCSPDLILDTATIFAQSTPGTITTYLRNILADHRERTSIGVRFEKFTDGRSYSIASRLREAGYAGELHALGDINQELVFLLRRAGFTHFHLPDTGIDQLAPEVLEPFNGYYQAGSDGTRAQWQM